MKSTKKETNKALRSMSIKQLQFELVELDKTRMKIEANMRVKQGSSGHSRNYPTQAQTSPFGNLKNVRKDIARVKTYLNVKMKHG